MNKGLVNNFGRAVLIGTIGLCYSSIALADAEKHLSIAVASNFTATAKKLFSRFEQQYATKITVSSGSSGAIYAQLIHGAPFDVFLSADTLRPELLEQQTLILSGTRLTYARGQLALWDKGLDVNNLPVDAKSILTVLNNTRRLSMANPTTAPYGSAAKQLLKKLGIWSALSSNVIQGNSVLQAYQFVETANVNRGLVAYHLVKNQTHVLPIPEKLSPFIDQQMVVLKHTKNIQLAKALQVFLLSDDVQRQLLSQGYANLNIPRESI